MFVLIAAKKLENCHTDVAIAVEYSVRITTYLKFTNARDCQNQVGPHIEESGGSENLNLSERLRFGYPRQ